MSDAARLIALARSLDVRVAVAESLTGGLLAAEIVSVPGASAVFSGGIIAYDTGLKKSLLRVDAELLAQKGPVDREVAAQMARGVREACAVSRGAHGDRSVAADLGLATTGVAGPDSDPQTGQAAGTVWIAASFRDQTRAVLLHGLEHADRQTIRVQTVHAAIELAILLMQDEA